MAIHKTQEIVVCETQGNVFYRCTKCQRMMPSSEYTPEMIRDRRLCMCTLCVTISIGAKVSGTQSEYARKRIAKLFDFQEFLLKLLHFSGA